MRSFQNHTFLRDDFHKRAIAVMQMQLLLHSDRSLGSYMSFTYWISARPCQYTTHTHTGSYQHLWAQRQTQALPLSKRKPFTKKTSASAVKEAVTPIITHKRPDAQTVNTHRIETASDDEFSVCIYQHFCLSVSLFLSQCYCIKQTLISCILMETSSTIKVECVLQTWVIPQMVCVE